MKSRTSAQDQRLKFWNRVVYNALAPIYNGLDWLTFGMWWRLVRRALDYVPADQDVLEIGFGPGKLHVELARRAHFCTGLDLAAGMCQFTQDRLIRAELTPRVVRGNVFQLPYPKDRFDVVVSTFTFSGFPDGKAALREMVRVLSPGGQMVLVDIGLPADGNRVGTFWAHLWEQMGDYLYDLPGMFAEAGLDVVTCTEYGPDNHIRVVVGEKSQ